MEQLQLLQNGYNVLQSGTTIAIWVELVYNRIMEMIPHRAAEFQKTKRGFYYVE